MSESDEIFYELDLAIQQINRQLRLYRTILGASLHAGPTIVEVISIAALIHSFYNGMENAFKRIALEVDEEFHKDADWHKKLIERMGKPTDKRPAVISIELLHTLEDYLKFRHMFLNNYMAELEWDRFSNLALACESTMARFKTEIRRFKRELKKFRALH